MALAAMGGALIVRHGRAVEEIPRLAVELGVDAVYANRDYEPEAILRDAAVAQRLKDAGIAFHDCKDQVIFERDEVVSGAGRPFTVFTPYKNAWLKRVGDADLAPHPVAEHAAHLARPPFASPLPALAEMGFRHTDLASIGVVPGMRGARAAWNAFRARLAAYDSERDRPDRDGTSRLSVHLRFGTVSVRELARHAFYAPGRGAQVWLSELIWREFFQQMLYHHPHLVTRSFRSEFDRIHWPGTEAHFAAWCTGQTGYPIVDAGMRELNATGFMHNRVRMIVASFLTKDLLVPWLKGERYFAAKLLDYDLAANNGNWQWAASTGCDAQPWFRIFNPVTQSQKFDPEGHYIRRWVKALAAVPLRYIHAPWTLDPSEQVACGVVIGRDYPAPIVDHAAARERALALFKAARAGG